MEKKAKRKVLEELLVYYPKGKGIMNISLCLSGISAIGLTLPVVFLWLAIEEVFLMYPNVVMTPTLSAYIYASVAVAVGSILIYCISLLCSHKVAFAVAKQMKYDSMSHLMNLPLGYFQDSGSGKLRRTISESATRTETYLAHQLPDMVGAFLTPVVILGLLFFFD